MRGKILSFKTIAKLLNRGGFTTSKGTPYNEEFVRGIASSLVVPLHKLLLSKKNWLSAKMIVDAVVDSKGVNGWYK